MTMTTQTDLSELRLWQLISPALPVGAYAYSQGLEFAVENHWLRDAEDAYHWIGGQLEYNLARLDIPVLARLYRAWSEQDSAQIVYWNDYLLSSRESRELCDEDRQLGVALLRLLDELGSHKPDTLSVPCRDNISFATAFCLAATHWDIALPNSARGYLWAWSENQVAAAIKLIPLGQTAGQKLLLRLAELIPAAVETGLQLDNDNIGSASYGVAMASAFHETQYTRLFRS